MKRLFLLDYFRGPDSTGLAAISGPTWPDRVKIAKIASHPLDLFDMSRFKEALNGKASQVFIGHNRAATKGAVINPNAHPFRHGNIIGAHNGTLSPGSFAELKKKLGEDYDVDSEAIIASIDRFGPKETLPLMQGAWALVWFNLEENTLNFLRNDQRPFWIAYSKELDRIFWASEYHMIQAAAALSSGANKLELYIEEKTNYQCWETRVDEWLSFKMEQLLTPGKSPPKPLSKTLKGKEPAPVAAAGTSDPFGSGGRSSSTSSTTTSRGTDRTKTIVTLLCDDKTPFGEVLSPEEFASLAEHGCSWCGEKVDVLDEGLTVFARDQILLCPSCSSGAKPSESQKGSHARLFVKNLPV